MKCRGLRLHWASKSSLTPVAVPYLCHWLPTHPKATIRLWKQKLMGACMWLPLRQMAASVRYILQHLYSTFLATGLPQATDKVENKIKQRKGGKSKLKAILGTPISTKTFTASHQNLGKIWALPSLSKEFIQRNLEWEGISSGLVLQARSPSSLEMLIVPLKARTARKNMSGWWMYMRRMSYSGPKMLRVWKALTKT